MIFILIESNNMDRDFYIKAVESKSKAINFQATNSVIVLIVRKSGLIAYKRRVHHDLT